MNNFILFLIFLFNIFSYLYIYVCVCVCVRENLVNSLNHTDENYIMGKKTKHINRSINYILL